MISSIALTTFITLGGWSVHSDGTYTYKGINHKYNNSHNAIILERWNVFVGTYKNSYYRRSNVSGFSFRNNFSGIYIGGVSGYNKHDKNCINNNLSGICPYFSAYVSYKKIKLMIMPKTLALALEFNI